MTCTETASMRCEKLAELLMHLRKTNRPLETSGLWTYKRNWKLRNNVPPATVLPHERLACNTTYQMNGIYIPDWSGISFRNFSNGPSLSKIRRYIWEETRTCHKKNHTILTILKILHTNDSNFAGNGKSSSKDELLMELNLPQCRLKSTFGLNETNF